MALQLVEIADITVASPVTSVTFSSIPQGYTDLSLRLSVRTSAAADFELIRFSLNGVEGSFRELYGTSATVGQGQAGQHRIGYASGATTTANTFANGELYIPNYTGTTAKTSWADMVNENGGSVSVLSLTVNASSVTSGINSINVFLMTGSFVANSTFGLYGVL